ncbi:ORF157 [Lymantria xylina nucleopolyhedrovirus]|uniref:38.2 kDa protein n=2 Tax=Lymantria xylina nucleopolyhedrovirus TaxID=166921 RepID=Q5MAS7_9ABAC|nr:ORF157 [Lymantria xylina nucleopolyhedrovirus]AAW28856.1 38.2 kDa protein [Lymantria xylina nucleopolyhedrovirus]ADD73866.1 ORF157 [Lymantria xylina nucleopolyhedrovirus]
MSYKYYFEDSLPENDKRFIFKGVGDVERPRQKLNLRIAVYDAKNRPLDNARALTAELAKLKIHIVCVQNAHKDDSIKLAEFRKVKYGRIWFSKCKKIKLGHTTVLLVNAEKNHDESVKRYSRQKWRWLNERLIVHHYDCFPNKARTIVVGTCPSLGKDARLAHGGCENSMYTDKLTLFCMHHKLKMVNTFAKNLQTSNDHEVFMTKHIDAVELRYVSVCNLKLLMMDACMEVDRFDFDYIPRQPPGVCIFDFGVCIFNFDAYLKMRRSHYKKTLTKLDLSKVMSRQRLFVKSAMLKYVKHLNQIGINETHELQDFISDLQPYYY